MSNQTAAAVVAIATSVNWERKGLDRQAIIRAGNQGRLGGPLTDWLVSQGWNLGKFVVKAHFVVDTSRKAKVKISHLGDNLRNWLINTVEDLPLSGKLEPFVLPESMYDKDIIVKLGGVAKAMTSMGEMFRLMKLQPEGPKSEPGQLLTNGYPNIFYVRQAVTKIDENKFGYADINDELAVEELEDSQYLFEVAGQWFVLRSVGVCWSDDGWYVYAYSVEDPSRWNDGYLVFSRNSALVSSETLVPAQA